VKYHKKENGGKHTAMNVAWDLAEGMFMVQLDADDRLMPHSVKFLVDTYFGIPEAIRDQYWCVHGRFVTQHGKFVGNPYPEGVNDRHWTEAREMILHCRGGDKLGLQKRESLAPYRFPEPLGVHHVSESIIWKRINKVYGTWYTNEVLAVNYVGEGGNLSAKKTTRRQFSPLAFRLKWEIIHEQEYGRSVKNLVCYPLVYYVADSNFRKHNGYMEGIGQHRVLLSLLQPIMFVGAFVYRTLKGIK
jgi:glycosyltransferase involved in cell wall biosynthesis